MLSFNVKMTVMSFGYRCNSNMIKLQLCSCTVSQFQHLWLSILHVWCRLTSCHYIIRHKNLQKRQKETNVCKDHYNKTECDKNIVSAQLSQLWSPHKPAVTHFLLLCRFILIFCWFASTSFRFSHQRWDAPWFQDQKKGTKMMNNVIF